MVVLQLNAARDESIRNVGSTGHHGPGQRRGVMLHRALTAPQDWGPVIDPSCPAAPPRHGALSASHVRYAVRRYFSLAVLAHRLGGQHA